MGIGRINACNQRVYFPPVWYLNGTFTVYTWLIEAWTPNGMLSMILNGSVNIKGSFGCGIYLFATKDTLRGRYYPTAGFRHNLPGQYSEVLKTAVESVISRYN